MMAYSWLLKIANDVITMHVHTLVADKFSHVTGIAA